MDAAFTKNAHPESESAGMGLLGALALVAVWALGSVVFGPALAMECVVVGAVEEIIFTGIVFTILMRYFQKSASAATNTNTSTNIDSITGAAILKAAAITGLLFALCHLAYLWKVPVAFAFSLCMIWLYRRTRSLTWPICAHAAFDMLWFGLFALP